MQIPEKTVVALVVSFNRRELLRESLMALLAQSKAPDKILVIDNASTDGSAEMVSKDFPDIQLHKLSQNTGGAGGFTTGIAKAMQDNPEWIWIMDDDTIPSTTALEELLKATTQTSAKVFGSKVIWSDGNVHPMNTPKAYPFSSKKAKIDAKKISGTAIRSTSFVSMFFKASLVMERGLPVADYFIWNDDFEYSARLIKGSYGLLVPNSVVMHKTKKLGSSTDDPGDRFFYEVRNKKWMFKYSESLNSIEKFLYRISTFNRWRKTFKYSQEPQVLKAAKKLGLLAAKTPPKSNHDVFEFSPAVQESISLLER